MRKLTVETVAPVLLTRWLAELFPSISKGTIASAFRNKDIRVNGKRVGEDTSLNTGDEVTLYIPDDKLIGLPLDVACVSRGIVVAVKPAGVLSKAEGEADMEARVTKWLENRGEPGRAMACHRLDSGTGGLLIFARDDLSRDAVREMMEEGAIRKYYRCIVRGVPSPEHALLTAYLRKDAAKAIVSVYDRPVAGGRTAVTEYTLLRSDGRRSMLEVRLHTGRTHQIRAHLAYIGHPVLGDDKYGERTFNREYKARRQKLWAYRLEFAFAPEHCPALKELAGQVFCSEPPFDGEM